MRRVSHELKIAEPCWTKRIVQNLTSELDRETIVTHLGSLLIVDIGRLVDHGVDQGSYLLVGSVGVLGHDWDMALRNPVYLDMETLAAHADYHAIEYPVPTEVVERTSRGRSGEASARVGGVGGQLRGGNDVELQRSYTLAPKDKAVVSRVIDALIHENHVKTNLTHGISRNDLVEIQGSAELMPTSDVGKLMHLALLAIKGSNVSLSDLKTANLEPAFMEHAKAAYIDNALLPIPLLFRLEDTGLEPEVYLDLDPGNFVDSHTLDDVEGEVQVLGTVSRIIAAGEYLSAERWLLPGWERQMRRLLMAAPDIANTVQLMAELFDVDERPETVEPYLRGPAIILSATSIY